MSTLNHTKMLSNNQIKKAIQMVSELGHTICDRAKVELEVSC